VDDDDTSVDLIANFVDRTPEERSRKIRTEAEEIEIEISIAP
jgi:hypothetical protein